MSIFNQLPTSDIECLEAYIRQYGTPKNHKKKGLGNTTLEYFLRYWNKHKEDIYHLFGDKFIISKEIDVEIPKNQLQQKVTRLIKKYNSFLGILANEISNIVEENYSLQNLKYSFRDSFCWMENEYIGPDCEIPAKHTKQNKNFKIHAGERFVRLVGKLCTNLKFSKDYPTFLEEYENLRQEHSQILNQKIVKGELCLSIHPLDYITMSDNDCGWQSCMQWTKASGEYRLGTIEMMNSPYVIIAYLHSKENFYFGNNSKLCWNNKKWRQLFIVNKDIIIGNRQYPYNSSELQETAISWIKDIFSHITDYDETSFLFENESYCKIPNGTIVDFNINCDYMYNDIYDKRLAYIRANFSNSSLDLNFSGPAICTCCGEIIDYIEDENWDVAKICLCDECLERKWCDCCDTYHENTAFYTTADNYQVCEDVYEHCLHNCVLCNSRYFSLYGNNLVTVHINILNNSFGLDEKVLNVINNRYSFKIYREIDSEKMKDLFGPVKINEQEQYYYVDLNNITTEGLCLCKNSWSTQDWDLLLAFASKDKKQIIKQLKTHPFFKNYFNRNINNSIYVFKNNYIQNNFNNKINNLPAIEESWLDDSLPF